MITHGLVQTVNSSQSEAKKEKAADKVEKKTKAEAKAKAKAKVMAKAKAKGKAKVSKQSPREVVVGEKPPPKRKSSDAAESKKKTKKPKVAVSPHSTPVKKGGRKWKPSPMALKGTESGGKKDTRLQKAVDVLGELMDAMGAYKGKGDFHGPGPNFKKKFLALINPLNYCETLYNTFWLVTAQVQ